MKKSSTIIMIAIFFGFLSCGENNHLDTTKSFQDFTGPYFGQTPPGDKAEKLTWK